MNKYGINCDEVADCASGCPRYGNECDGVDRISRTDIKALVRTVDAWKHGELDIHEATELVREMFRGRSPEWTAHWLLIMAVIGASDAAANRVMCLRHDADDDMICDVYRALGYEVTE